MSDITDFESITDSELLKLENEEANSPTLEEQYYIEQKQILWSIEKQLLKVNTSLCELTSIISNIVFKLNDMDKNIILKP